MSVFSVFESVSAGLFVAGLFLWNVPLILISLVFLLSSIVLYLYDSIGDSINYEAAFWLFIASEVLVFGFLLFSCLFFDEGHMINLSSPLEIPLLGCFLLLGSSITVTGFHHLLKWEFAWVLLAFTIILGVFFVVLQVYELHEADVNLLDTTFHASSFCTVGLHFSHVLLGIVGLLSIIIVGVCSFGVYRCTVITWYWHFVDYVWLFVYMIVYVC